ncbi:MAG: hypothetical protein AB7D57_00790 [Desulfovibrionaceae bacterium]
MAKPKAYEQCVTRAQTAGLSRRDAEELVDMLAHEKRRMSARGTLGRAEAELAEFASRQAEEARINAALLRKQAALNILKRREVEAQLAGMEAQGVDTVEAVMGVLGGSQKRVRGARDSVSRTLSGIRDRWAGDLMNGLAERPHVVELLSQDPAFVDDVVREMMELRKDGNPGRTGNADAAWAAGKLAGAAEGARVRLNEAGAFIHKLEGWVPQSHDVGKMRARGVGEERWVEFIMPLLDRERTMPGLDDAKVREALGEVYQNIVTGRDRSIRPAQRGEFLGPRNLARSQGKHRVLHFKDAEAALTYHRAFGRGNVLTNVLSHLDISARKLALMERLGPNPEAMLVAVMEDRKRAVRVDATLNPKEKTRRIERLNRAWSQGLVGGKVRKLFAELTGETFIPENVTAARIGAGIRAVQSMAKLGGVLLSQFNDLATYAMSARVAGKNLFEAYLDGVGALLKGRRTPERRALARSLGTMIDGMLQDMTMRWDAQDSMPGTMQRWQNWFFKASGMTWWTENLKAGYSIMLSNHLAEARGRAWGELGPDLRGVLEHHGFGEAHWDLIRSIARQGPEGRWHVLPENVRLLSDEAVDALVPEGVRPEARDMYRKKARERLETDLAGFYADETRYAVLEPDERDRAILVQGTRPGSPLGEIVRFAAQFKSFPVAFTRRILAGRRWARNGRGFDAPGFVHFIAASLILGYASMSAKDMAKGRTPKDPTRIDTWLAAAAQSGGAGIYGDFFLSKVNRFGGGLAGSALGPGLSTGFDVLNTANDMVHGNLDVGSNAFYLALNNTPFINLWYTRAAADWMVFNSVREMLSPGSLRRAERRMKREFGQTPLWR